MHSAWSKLQIPGKKRLDLTEHRQTSDMLVHGRAELVVVYSSLARVHLDERIPHDVIHERPRVDLAEDESQRIR